MFDLPDSPPADFADLQRQLEVSARRRVEVPPGHDVVTLEGDAWPDGKSLSVNLSGCGMTVDADPGGVPDHLKPPKIVGDRQPGPTFESFRVDGDPLLLDVVGAGEVAAVVRVEGQRVAFESGKDKHGNWAMAPASGTLEATVSVDKNAMLAVIETRAKAEAAERGVVIEKLIADVSAPSERVARVAGRIEGSKKVAFFNATFAVDFVAELTAEADAAGELTGRVTTLDLHGDGAVMNMLLSAAKPAIAKVKERPLPLGDVLAAAGVAGLKVRDVKVSADHRLSLWATFGA